MRGHFLDGNQKHQLTVTQQNKPFTDQESVDDVNRFRHAVASRIRVREHTGGIGLHFQCIASLFGQFLQDQRPRSTRKIEDDSSRVSRRTISRKILRCGCTWLND